MLNMFIDGDIGYIWHRSRADSQQRVRKTTNAPSGSDGSNAPAEEHQVVAVLDFGRGELLAT